MRLSLLSLFATAAIASAANRKMSFSELTPKDVGAFHTDAFEKLANKYAKKKPKNRTDMIADISEIVASYCDDGDSTCVSNAYKVALNEFSLAEEGVRTIEYPDNFDSKLMDVIHDMYIVMEDMRDDIDGLTEALTALQSTVEDMSDVDEGHKVAALSGLSVAIESNKLWNDAYANTDHPLYGVHHESYLDGNEGGRRLQLNLDPQAIAIADVEAAISAVVDAIKDNPILITTPPVLAPIALAASIPASLAVLTGNDESDDNATDDDNMTDDNTTA